MGKAKRSAGGKQDTKTGKRNPAAMLRPKADRKVALLERAIKAFEEKLGNDQVKATVGDYVRLLQLQKEMAADEPKDIEVTWVEPDETESSEE